MVTNSIEECINICDENSCTGCSACYSICPTGSISMVENQWGEIHPHIEKKSCIRCKKCYSVCPNNNQNNWLVSKHCYAAWRKNDKQREDSSSGGIAALLYEKCFENGWSVYGVEYDRYKGVRFTCATSKKQLENYKGSKYVQATIEATFCKIKDDLKNGKNVLFIGSPCQVAGLEAFMRCSNCLQYRNQLVAIDFLCHGTVPQKYLFEEIQDIEKKKKICAEQVRFRSNDADKNYYLTLYQNDTEVYSVKAERQRYFYCFLHSITCRQSCINCQYKRSERVGDITLGDFIGIGKMTPVNLPKGINPSLVLINSKYGETLFLKILDECILLEREVQEAIDGGPSFHRTTSVSSKRNAFKENYLNCGFVSAADRAMKIEMNVKFRISRVLNLGRKVLRKLKHTKK